jgi:hypothetical protein
MSGQPAADPRYWRERAKRMRDKASTTTDSRAKRMLLAIAASYERLADRVEMILRQAEKIAWRY